MANNLFDKHGKGRLASKLALKLDITKKKAYQFTVALLEIMGETLKEEGRLELRGFGSFRVREGKLRGRHNPQTMEQLGLMASKTRPWFKPSKHLLEILNENKAPVPTNNKYLLHSSQRQKDFVKEGPGLQKESTGQIAGASFNR